MGYLKITGVAVLLTLLLGSSHIALYYRDRYDLQRQHNENIGQELRQTQVAMDTLLRRQTEAAALDARHTKALADAQTENNRLRRRLDDGGGVFIGRTASPNEPDHGSVTGCLGDGSCVRLTDFAGRNLLDIRAGIINDQQKIKYLQAWIRQHCAGDNNMEEAHMNKR